MGSVDVGADTADTASGRYFAGAWCPHGTSVPIPPTVSRSTLDRLLREAVGQSAAVMIMDADCFIAGFYTLATGQIDFGDLPPASARTLPRRGLPVAVLAIVVRRR